MPSEICWAEPCASTDPAPNLYVLNTSQRDIKSKCNTVVNICQEAINAYSNGGNITIDNNTFYQACGVNLPSKGSSPGAPPSHRLHRLHLPHRLHPLIVLMIGHLNGIHVQPLEYKQD